VVNGKLKPKKVQSTRPCTLYRLLVMQHSEQTKVNISLVQSKLKKVQNSAAS